MYVPYAFVTKTASNVVPGYNHKRHITYAIISPSRRESAVSRFRHLRCEIVWRIKF